MSTATAVSTRSTATIIGARTGREARTHLHLTRRGRFSLSVLAGIPLVVGAAVFAVNGGGAAASDDGAPTRFGYQIVQSGDSLWRIAERVAPHSDPRDVVARIVSLNQLHGSIVTPGQRVAIPAEYAVGR